MKSIWKQPSNKLNLRARVAEVDLPEAVPISGAEVHTLPCCESTELEEDNELVSKFQYLGA